ncbi:MAG TPA: Ig-like domain-containing protein, partial [Chitinophagales bacterium]|nr:Ig-like domain-containing protein [Chitinophagales bacterium]
MLHRLLRYAAFCASATLIVTCTSQKNLLTVTNTNFVSQVERDQNLSFTFNKPLVPDSLLGRWDTTAYIEFSPSVPGKFKWEANNVLVFSPSEWFAPSTDYTATLTKALLTNSRTGAQLGNENTTVQFHTPYLTMVGTQVFYGLDEQTQQVRIRFNLTFNATVRPDDVKQRLKLSLEGQPQAFDIVSTEHDDVVALALPDMGMETENKQLVVEIEPGLTPVGSTYTTKEKLATSANLPARDKFMITEMAASFQEGKAVVNLLFNQPVAGDKPEQFIRIEPKINFTAEKMESGLQLKGDFEPAKSYTVTLSNKMTGAFGYALESDYSDVVTFGELDPLVQFVNGNRLYMSTNGNRNIAIQIAAVQKVKVTVVKVYENNVMHFMKRDRSYDYYTESNGDDDYSWHEYQYYNHDGMGDQISERTYDVNHFPRNGNLRLLNLGLDDLDYNSSFKGVYIVKVEDTERQWLTSSALVSMSDLGVMVKESSKRITVFVNSIANAEPTSGVRVDLISSNNQKLFSATTDGDGVATFENLDTKLGSFKAGMIVCRKQQDFNFILLDRTRVETSRFDVGGRRSNTAKLDAFIYTDRNIYRPGDSIRTNTIVRTGGWETL